MWTHLPIWAAVLGLLAVLPAAVKAEPIRYDFTLIADNNVPGTLSSATLNNSGGVAFRRVVGGGFPGTILTGSGGPLTLIASGPTPQFLPSNPSINAGGIVAFTTPVRTTGFATVSVGSGGPTTALYLAGLGQPLDDFFGLPSLNDAGTVAFGSRLRAGGAGIFTGNGGPLTTVADTGSLFSGFGTTQFPSLNNSGTVAFFADLAAGGSGIFVGGGGPVTTIADTGGLFSSFGTSPAPSLNDVGMVAFFATLNAGGSGIFVGAGGSVTTIADTAGPFSGFGASPFVTINDAGVVLFFATLDDGGSGIFVGPDPVANRVIGTGDFLFGSTVVGLGLFREALNDAGQVAFVATLADGRQVVVRADPAGAGVIPEPSSLTLVGLGALGLLAYVRRRRLTFSARAP